MGCVLDRRKFNQKPMEKMEKKKNEKKITRVEIVNIAQTKTEYYLCMHNIIAQIGSSETSLSI